jgi:hypothetical protein
LGTLFRFLENCLLQNCLPWELFFLKTVSLKTAVSYGNWFLWKLSLPAGLLNLLGLVPSNAWSNVLSSTPTVRTISKSYLCLGWS